MRHLYGMGDKVFGPFGFYDAFSETDNRYPQRYLAIDQGPIAVMIDRKSTRLGKSIEPSYFHEMRNLTLVNRAYCIRNPKHYKGFGPDCWGLTASYSVDGYAAHSPNEQEDKGVISPTAALSSIVYTPEYSMQVMRHLYGMGDKVFGPFGFYDAFSETDNWYPLRYLAIDQGPIAVMIENYRSGLLWKLFMSHPDVQAGLTKLGFNTNKQDVRQK